MFKIKTIVFFIFLLVMPFFGSAQQEKMAAALNYLQKGNLDSARICIDEAVANPSTADDTYAWHIKGYVYTLIYKEKEKSNKKSPSRLIALESIKKSITLDVSKQFLNENTKNMKSLTSGLFNDAASSLDTINYEIAVFNFEKFKNYYPLADPSSDNLEQREIEFNIELGKVYAQLYRQNREKNKKFFGLAKNAYNVVLSLDTNNISANYHMGILYYNQAVDLINDTDYGIDFVALNEIQDNSIILFKQSLPFMVKAYELNPNKKETLIGLSGIYFGLNDKEKSDEFKQRSEELEKGK